MTAAAIQLDLFEVWKPPHIKKWDSSLIRGWRPKVGAICRVAGICWNKPPTDYTDRRAVFLMTGYIMAVNEKDAEVILPFLKKTPWCVQQHLIVPFESLEPEITYGFDEEEFRRENPITI